jgi:hypothetical protein
MSHSDNFVIESYLPQVGSPLFYHAVEEFVSLWEAFPSASYQQVLFQFLVNSLLSTADDDSWYDQVGNSVSSVVADVKESFFVANVVSDEVKRFQQSLFPKIRVDNCPSHNKCSDKTCQLFHGPICDFHAGKNTDNRRRLPNGATNPRFGKPMLCGKGASCPFDHASAEVRASREMAVLQQNRLRFAPPLSTEADLIAFGLEWRFADVYTYGHLAAEKMDLLEICLERSGLPVLPLEGGFSVLTNDFHDARFAPPLEIAVPVMPLPEGFTVVSRRR